jgi:lipoprotein-releasing system ATP-binding protein
LRLAKIGEKNFSEIGAVVEVENISKTYPGDTPVEVLRSVSFRVESGQIVAITGASGAGKSTLLQLIGTLDRPDTGRILVDGVDVFGLKSSELSRFRNRELGFVFQFHHLLVEFSALENVALPARLAGKSAAEAEALAHDLLLQLGLQHRVHHRPTALSGGEQQRVAIARALINNPKVVLADEPSGNLDSANAEALHDLFFQLRETRGQTFIIVTHNSQLALRSDRVLSMKAGSIVEPETI